MSAATPHLSTDTERPLSPQESCEFYRLADEVGSGRMTLPDLMRLAARRGVAQAAPNPTLWGQIAAIYGQLDAEDCKWIDREWAKQRGYILPTDGTSTLAYQPRDAYEVARHIIGYLEGNCGLSFIDVKQDDWDTVTRLVATLAHSSTHLSRPKIIGRATGKEYDGDQVAGMPGAICHACGLKGYPCANPDCPNLPDWKQDQAQTSRLPRACATCNGLGRIPHESGGYGINCPTCSVTSTPRGAPDA